MASLKMMAPLFTAYDRDLYSKLIPDHLKNLHSFPKEIIQCFESGAFTASLTARQWKSVALDEAHEMCINKDLKQAILRPTQAYLQKTSLFFNYRIELYKNILEQIFPEQTKTPQVVKALDLSAESIKVEGNINQMVKEILKADLLPTLNTSGNRGLVNPFSMQKATAEQQHDMLHFYHIGKQAFESYINYYLLKVPSATY